MNPRSEYQRRRDLWQQRCEATAARDDRLANVRMAIFVAGGVVIWRIFGHDAHIAWVFLPCVLFAYAVIQHVRTQAERDRAQHLLDHYDRGLARLDADPRGDGHTGETYLAQDHPHALHLDLFGPRSVFARLSFARTRSGRACLASWLLEPADAPVLRARHAAIDATRLSLDLREDLASIRKDVADALDDGRLRDWAQRPTTPMPRALATALGTATPLALIAMKWITLWPFLVLGALQMAYAWQQRARVASIVDAARKPAQELALVAHVLARLERESFDTGRFRELRTSWTPGDGTASEHLAAFSRLVDRHDWRANQMFALVAPVVLWSTRCAWAMEAWRAQWGDALAGWLASVGECEALLDLSRYAFENPDDPFPELVDDPVFEATQITHPLLPRGAAIRNDFAIGEKHRMWIVTGSNMSGKSTLLRAVGVNAILAMAGAPVRAEHLRIGPLALAASIRTMDSLRDGASRFYAEIQALQRVVAATDGPRTVLFLLDELLHGTNSHDRRVGAGGLLRGLLTRRAIGVVTTHDLALAKLEQEIGAEVGNAHFECTLAEGQLQFDYTLKPGVVKTSNALELMRAVGLDV